MYGTHRNGDDTNSAFVKLIDISRGGFRGGALGAEAPPPYYFDLALGHHEPGLSIYFKSRLILIYSFTQH